MNKDLYIGYQAAKLRISIIVVFASCVVSFLVASCGKGEVKKISEDSKIATEAFSLAEKIREAYAKKDLSTIEKNSTREGFRTISSVLKPFDSVDMTFNPAFVQIEDDLVYLNVAWRGTWQKGGRSTEERGMAVFVLKGRPLKIDNILRANPFRYPAD